MSISIQYAQEIARRRRHAARKEARKRLAEALGTGNSALQMEALWQALSAYEGYHFRTAKGLVFQYTVKGNEIFFSRKEKSVTVASVAVALETSLQFQRMGIPVTGPKRLSCFGASYLYPVLQGLGVITYRNEKNA